MRYPSNISFRSAIYPKLLGSYEKEISHIIHGITQKPYTAIVDIGCAEGYYAVGLGSKCSKAKVFAFDTSEIARELCQQMAQLNGVSISSGGFCGKKTLLGLELGAKALIFSDCEGYETELFDVHLISNLKPHDFLVETHDFIKIDSTKIILDAFTKTHDCEIVESIDDILKAYSYEYRELHQLNLAERRRVLAEGRPQIMRWVFAKARPGQATDKPILTGYSQECHEPTTDIETVTREG